MTSIQLPIYQESQSLSQENTLMQGLRLLDILSQNFSNPHKYLSSIQDSLTFFPSNLHVALSLNSIFLTFLSFFSDFTESYSSVKSHLISIFQSSISQEAKYQVHLEHLNTNLICTSQSMISTLIGRNLNQNQVFSLLACTELFHLSKSIPLEL